MKNIYDGSRLWNAECGEEREPCGGGGGWSEARVSRLMTQGAALIRRTNPEERGQKRRTKEGLGRLGQRAVLFPMQTVVRRNKDGKARP